MHWISQGSHGLLMEFCLRKSEISKMCGVFGTNYTQMAIKTSTNRET